MIKQIMSERASLFEPDIYIGVVVKLKANIETGNIIDAVNAAYSANETTMSKVVINDAGVAYYEKMPQTGCKVYVENADYCDIYEQNCRKTFNIAHGELVRTFVIPGEEKVTVLIMAHHLAGDGKAIILFAKDVLSALDGKSLIYKQAVLISQDELESRCELPFMMKMWINHINKIWNKNKQVFGWKQYQNIHTKYWSKAQRSVDIHIYTNDVLDNFKYQAKNNGITVNSILVAHIQQKCPDNKVIGIPISVRQNNDSMVNMTSGIRICHSYRRRSLVAENAIIIHRKIKKMTNNHKMKYFALSFVAQLEGTFVDGVLMQLYDLYDNVLTRKMVKYMGYNGKTKTQLGITNVGEIFVDDYDRFTVDDIFVIPPKVSYSDVVVGVSTFNGRLHIAIAK